MPDGTLKGRSSTRGRAAAVKAALPHMPGRRAKGPLFHLMPDGTLKGRSSILLLFHSPCCNAGETLALLT